MEVIARQIFSWHFLYWAIRAGSAVSSRAQQNWRLISRYSVQQLGIPFAVNIRHDTIHAILVERDSSRMRTTTQFFTPVTFKMMRYTLVLAVM
jgi:hypothetical protein